MTLKQKIYLVCLILMQVISFLAFMLGFFSIKTIPSRNSSLDDLPTKINNISIHPKDVYHQHIDKFILMVIDGLRYDFVVGDSSENNMPYLHSLVNKSDHCLLKVRVETPTVTMPRIKALMTGNIPGFLDVIQNFKTYEVIEDNILRQARKNGFSSIFYGDETWVNLFPHEFKRNETTSSFYVNDFYEVDDNVTRNLMRELNSSDWDIMILHYLGLDHIGHAEGPQSPYITPKLNEMDIIISKIYKYINQSGENVILLVCGDHGMRDSGGHGGSSTAEVLVPFLFLNYGCDTNLRNADVNQIDLTMLISVLLGLPIPATNLGKLNYKLIKNLDPLTKLYAMHYSTYCLKQIYDSQGFDNYTNPDFLTNLQKAENLFEMWIKSGFTNNMEDLSIHYYFEAQKFMSEKLVELNVNFNVYLMLISVLLLLQIWWMLLRKSQLHYNKQRSLMSLSFFFFLLLIMNYIFCNYSLVMCPKDTISKLMTILLLAMVSFSLFLVKPLKRRWKVSLVADLPLLILFLLHLFSYASSSYIEEEHQFWYFLLSTICIYLIISKGAYSVIAILIANRFLRKLNQTGNKWAFVPDIGDWLHEEQNTNLLLFAYLSGQFAIVYWCLKNISGKHVKGWGLLLEKILFIAEILIITKYKFAIGNLKLPGVLLSPSRGIIEVRLFWICLTFQLLLYIASFNYRNLKKGYMMNLIEIFLILMLEIFSLLHRPHNIVLIPGMLFCLDVLNNYFCKDEYYIMVLYQSIGMVFYFYQGNSNGLATIDITAGFVGLEGFNLTISGFYVFLNTFSSIILSNVLLLRTIFYSGRKEELSIICSAHSSSGISYKEVEYYWFTNFFCCSYILFYIVLLTFQRHHLFVWTVFSPKLLYMGCELLLYGIILLTLLTFEVFHFIVANCLKYEFNKYFL